MTAEDFISKTKAMLAKIEASYGQSWYSRMITEDEFKVTPCEGCKGTGCFKLEDEKEVNCVADHEDGSYYERCFDADEFANVMENEIIFGNGGSPFYDLLSCDIITRA